MSRAACWWLVLAIALSGGCAEDRRRGRDSDEFDAPAEAPDGRFDGGTSPDRPARLPLLDGSLQPLDGSLQPLDARLDLLVSPDAPPDGAGPPPADGGPIRCDDCRAQVPFFDCCRDRWSCEEPLICGVACEDPGPPPEGLACACVGSACAALLPGSCTVRIIDREGSHLCPRIDPTTERPCGLLASCLCARIVHQRPEMTHRGCMSAFFEFRALETFADVCFTPGVSLADVLRREGWQAALDLQIGFEWTEACEALPVVNPVCNHDADCPEDTPLCVEDCDDDCLGYPFPCCSRRCGPLSAPYVCEGNAVEDGRQCTEAGRCPGGFSPAVDARPGDLWDCECCMATDCGLHLSRLPCAQAEGCRWRPRACADGFCGHVNEGECLSAADPSWCPGLTPEACVRDPQCFVVGDAIECDCDPAPECCDRCASR